MANPMREELLKDLCESSAKSELCDAKTFEECKTARGDCGFCTITADYLLKQGWKKFVLNVGDTVYMKGVPLKISFIHIENDVTYVVQFDCNDCGDCPFYEDDVSFEGEHDCCTRGYMEFTEEEIGKTVFLSLKEDNRFHGNGEYDGKVIHCPNCNKEVLIEFGSARCFLCSWSASNPELDELMPEADE